MERKIIETEVKRRPNIMVAPQALALIIEKITNLDVADSRYIAIRIVAGERWMPGPEMLRPEFQDLTKVPELTWYCTVVPHFEEIYDEPVQRTISAADLKTLINNAAMGDSLSMVKLAGMLIRGELKITQV